MADGKQTPVGVMHQAAGVVSVSNRVPGWLSLQERASGQSFLESLGNKVLDGHPLESTALSLVEAQDIAEQRLLRLVKIGRPQNARS